MGKREITIGNGGYGQPIYGFGCITLLKNNSLKLELIEDEEKAVENTKETVWEVHQRELFRKEIQIY